MRAIHASVALVTLSAACGIEQQVFVDEYNRLRCEQKLECEDPALLTFDGILTVEQCEERTYPDVSQWGLGCLYAPVAAEECLASLEAITGCAAENVVPEPPQVCQTVFRECTGGTQNGPDPEPEQPADTDADGSPT